MDDEKEPTHTEAGGAPPDQQPTEPGAEAAPEPEAARAAESPAEPVVPYSARVRVI